MSVGEVRHTTTSYCKSDFWMFGGIRRMVNFISLSRRVNFRKCQALVPFLLVILVLPTFIAVAAPLTEDPISEFAELLQDTRPLIDESIDEEAIVEQAQALIRSQFTENRGQVGNEEVLFYGQIPNGMIGFGVSKIFVWLENTTSSIVMTFEDANSVTPKQDKVAFHKSNYFLGDRGTFTGIKSSELILYENLWEGIDLEYRATPQGAKYEFHVEPGASPEQIQIQYEGQDEIQIANNVLIVANQNQFFRDDGLLVTQGEKILEASFERLSEDTVGFGIDAFDTTQEIVIDPLVYSTYLGGYYHEYACMVKIDSSNNIYVVGMTGSSDFPVVGQSVSPFTPADITFITKFNASGNQILYSTFVGGTGGDFPLAMVVDDLGHVFVTGYTQSVDFPVLNAYNDSLNGPADCFVFKLNTTGNGLVFSTYIGGSEECTPWDMDIDDEGNVYVVGVSEDDDFPLVNWFDNVRYGDEGFLFKLNSTGNGLVYSTYLGGSEDDEANGIAVDSEGNAYVVGCTAAVDFPTQNAMQSSLNDWWDGFIMKVNATGNGLVYSTYLGSSDGDNFYSVAVDIDGNAYVSGTTNGDDFPMQNPVDSIYDGNGDIVVFKMNATGTGLIYSTYFGGSNGEPRSEIAINDAGEAYVVCMTNSTDFPTINAYSDTLNVEWDLAIFKLSSAGNELCYSTYVGGSDVDDIYDGKISVDGSGNVYVGCVTRSDDFPMVNAYNSTFGGVSDCVILKLADNSDSDDDELGNYFEDLLGTDRYDWDSDDDLMSDGWEYYHGLDPLTNDAGEDPDLDSLTNYLEFTIGTEPFNNDTDYDSMPDGWEVAYGLNPLLDDATGDLDSDYLWNIQEYLIGTFPNNNDTDSDLMIDSWEYFNSLDPLVDDAGDDPDSDLLSNYFEYLLECNPFDNDTDSDSLLDGAEYYTYGTDPTDDDSDWDDMPDGWEVANGLDPLTDDAYDDLDLDLLQNIYEWQNGTLANNNDTDFDLMPDGWEVLSGLNPLFDDAGDDLDLDTLSNLGEYQNGTDASLPDSDFDTLSDGLEVLVYHTNPLSAHSDSDIMPDAWEIQHSLDPLVDDSHGDPDLDLLLNEDEYTWGTDPQNPDSDFDSYSDGYEVHTIGSDPMNPDSPVVVPREPDFSTYLGGSSDDTLYDAVVDSLGNIYVTGQTYSTNFPTVGPYDSTYNGNWDVMVVKFNSTGNGIIFSTYIGGSSVERGLEFYIDADFSVWLAGYTTSSSFPTVNAYDSTYNGGWDAFVVHLSTSGSSLLYSTFIGGTSDDLAEFIYIDNDGYLYLSGFTRSSNFPVANGYDSTFNGDRDAFALKMQPDLHGLVYSTFLGGSGYDYTYGSQIAANGDFIISGVTTSSNFPMYKAYDSTYNGGDDIFATRLNGAGNQLVFSTYIGGSGEEYFGKFGLDEEENLIMGGSTMSTNFPTLNAYDSTYDGIRDAFALKLASNGSTLLYSTYFGGPGSETVYGVQVDQWNNIYISGVTDTGLLPVKNAFQNESQGGDDTFVFKLNSTGNGLLYSTYLGGSGDDGMRGLAIDRFGRVYIVGWTQSSDYPLFNAYDSTTNGGTDGFVTCLPPLDDQDLDGLPDEIEISIGSNQFLIDTDLDLMPDGWEYYYGLNPLVNDSAGDLDLDTLTNLQEFNIGTFPDNADSDFDLMPDAWEYIYGLLPSLYDAYEDFDSDTLTNIQEFLIGTYPNNSDSDSDLMDDAFEFNYGLNPLVDDASDDADNDNLSNLIEFQIGTNPTDDDSDWDLMPDGWEYNNGLDPLHNDASQDPDNDNLTNYYEFLYLTNPLSGDTDLDTMPDGWEIENGLDPTVDDGADDEDGDTLTNAQEFEFNTNPNLADSDSDSLNDADEVLIYHTDPNLADTDLDSLTDGAEVHIHGTSPTLYDTDFDTLSDYEELFIYGTNPLSADSDGDGISDAQEIAMGLDPTMNNFVANIGIILAIVLTVIISITYWRKVHIPRQRNKKLGIIRKFINNSKVKGDTESYEVEENTPLWYLASIFASHTKKGGQKKDLAPIMTQLVEKEFPAEFGEGAEKTLIGMCLELAEHKHFDVLSALSEAISVKLSEQRFRLKLKDNDFRIKCWRLSILLVKKPGLRGEVREQLGKASEPINELYRSAHLREEFVPYLSQILVNIWDDATYAKQWIASVFKPFDFEYKLYFLKELHQVSQSYEKITMFDAILGTIQLKTILERPQAEWENIIDNLVALGYASRPMTLNTEDLAGGPLKQRIDLATIIQTRKKNLEMEKAFTSLLFVDQKDYNSFYDLELPESIITYFMNEFRKVKSPGQMREAPFIQLNKTGILNILHSYQKKEITQRILDEILDKIPEEILDKIHGQPDTRSIFRYVSGSLILDYLNVHQYDHVIAELKRYRAPYDSVVEAVENSINQMLVTHGNDKSLQDFLLTLQSELLESEADKKSVRKIVEWLKIWGLINTTTKGEENKEAYVAGLLDVVKETKGEFEPRAIADQALTLLTDDLDKSVRIFKGGGIINNLLYQAKTVEARTRLESIKHVYYKLLLLADNQDLALSGEDREFMRKVANEVLSFVIKIRRNDFLERMNHVSVGLAEVIDPGALLNKTFGHSSFATLPETFQTFALPAMLVLNEFLTNPIRIPFVGSKEEGVLINPMFWVFGAAVSLALAPIMAHTELTYSDYFIIEYLKTTTLAVKKAEGPIAKLLVKILPELTPENLLVKALKQLMYFHHLQGIITRDMIIEALEFGGWPTELADKIIEEKDYCIYCSFELPKDAQVCPNCNREVKAIDISSLTSEEIAVDLSQLGMDVGDTGPTPGPAPGPVLRQEDMQPRGDPHPIEEESVEDKYCKYCSLVLPEDAEVCPNCEKPVGGIKEDE